MSVDDPKVVDAIGIEQDSDIVVLTISDHRDWLCCDDHLLALQAKINHYLSFIELELLDAYPLARGRSIRIDVVCKYPPTEPGNPILAGGPKGRDRL